MGIKGAVKRSFDRAFREPIHSAVMNSMMVAAIGGFAGGIISTNYGDPGVVVGFATVGLTFTFALWMLPHPEVIVDDWIAEQEADSGVGDDA